MLEEVNDSSLIFFLSNKTSHSVLGTVLAVLSGTCTVQFPFPKSHCKGTRLEILPWECRLHQAFKILSCVAPLHMLLLCIYCIYLFSFTPFWHPALPCSAGWGKDACHEQTSSACVPLLTVPLLCQAGHPAPTPSSCSPQIRAPERSLSAC